ncbi:outer membrane protein [Vibrio coralliilyticus]|uniref:outer membrane protein n=1 Tax=Vibrio coralliilyticus TaxID=190893 RepID=UPI0015619951|nr:outer membrane beta-barrel protein [Vibrio coralliilyticus]NRF17019.1 porin family protein [Vibrio coralliilyticus]
MKKTLLLAATAALVSMPSLADQSYVALELGGGSYTTSGQDSSASAYQDIEDTGFLSLKGGYYFNKNLRAYGYIQTNGESSVEYQTFGITVAKAAISSNEIGAGADYLHNVTEQFYLLAGANLGVYKSELELSAMGVTPADSSNTGLTAGLNLGLGYHFTDNFSMELGYRHSQYFSNEHKLNFGGNNIEVNFDASNTGYLNASYSF